MSESTFYMPSPNILLYYTMDGARLLCTQCKSILDAPKLKVTSQHNNYQNGYLWANKTDYLADINIPAFSSCKTLGQCPAIMRNITPWMETKDDLLSNGHPTVLCNENNLGLLSSYCYCRTGNGFIYPLTSGQNPMDMDPTQLTFDDIFFLLDQGNQKALDYINDNKEAIQNIIQKSLANINESLKTEHTWRVKEWGPDELARLSSDYLDAALAVAQNRLDGKKSILPAESAESAYVENKIMTFLSGPDGAKIRSKALKDIEQNKNATIDRDIAHKIWGLAANDIKVDGYVKDPILDDVSIKTSEYLSRAQKINAEIPDYPEVSQISLLTLVMGRASQPSEIRQMLPVIVGVAATIGVLAIPILAPYLATATGYAVTTASTLISQHPIIGHTIVGVAEGATLAGLDSSIRNTKIVTDANGLPSFLRTDPKAIAGDMVIGGAIGGTIGLGKGSIITFDQGYNNWLNAPNTIGGNSRIPLSFAPNEPFTSSAFDLDINKEQSFKSPSKRHYYNNVSKKTRVKDKNTMIGPGVDVKTDVELIQAGKAQRNGDTYTVNGRIYGVTPGGELYPQSGENLYPLSRGSMKALQLFKQNGDIPEVYEFFKNMNIPEEDALEYYNLFN